MEIKKFTLGPVMTNLYVVSENGHGFIVDCADISPAVESYISKNNIKIDFILQTHTHYDHVLGLSHYKNLYDVDVYASSMANDIANDINYNLAYSFPNLEVPIDHYLDDGDTIDEFGIKVLYTPGHSLDSISFLIEDKLFSGDVLFNLSIGRTDLPGGDYRTLMESIAYKLVPLGIETEIYPGHGENTNIAFELMNNPFLN